MAGRKEKAKSKSTGDIISISALGDNGSKIIFEYADNRYEDMLRNKELLEKKILFLLASDIAFMFFMAAVNGQDLLNNIRNLSIESYLYIIIYTLLIISMTILVCSFRNTFLRRKIFRYLLKKLYKIDVYKDLDLKDRTEKAVKAKEKDYKRKLIKAEKKRIADKVINESCRYKELEYPAEILKVYKKRYKDKPDKLYEYLSKVIDSEINDGRVINRVKSSCFNTSLVILYISMILMAVLKVIFN